MTLIELKQVLLQTELVEDNIYLDNYCSLCLTNIVTQRQQYKTNLHHVIPVAFYKINFNVPDRKQAEKLATVDKNNFSIYLLYKDHLLAHYYLAMCAKTSKAIASMMAAVQFLTGHTNIELKNLDLSDTELAKYQSKYEAVKIVTIKETASKNTGKKRTLETRLKLSLANSGKKRSAEVRQHLSEVKKGQKLSEETKAKISAANKGKKQPWAGRKQSAEEVEKRRQKLLGHATSIETRKKLSQANKGKKLSEETKQKLSMALKGKPAWNKGLPASSKGKIGIYDPNTLIVNYVDKSSLAEYLENGYLLGNPKCGRKGHKGTRNVRVLCIEEQKYFESIKAAAIYYNISQTAIHQCLAGRSKTAAGYHWSRED